MIEKIEKEYNKFIKNEFGRIYTELDFELGNNVWANIWKYYYTDNNRFIDLKIEELKNGLDERSKETIDLITERYFFILPWQNYKKYFAYKKELIFTFEESIGQSEEFVIDKNKFKLPKGVEYNPAIFKHSHGLQFLSKKVLSNIKDKDIIDGGAFAGDSAIILNEYTTQKIHSFEPENDTFELLKKTISLNKPEDKIIPVNMGLGESTAEIDFYRDVFCNSAIVTDEVQRKFAEKIQVTSIDDYVNNNNVNPGLIKLDVEGYEAEVIKGALHTIQEYKPVLLISIDHHPKDFFEIKPLIKSIAPNYKFIVRKINDFSLTSETMLIGWVE